jgi:hypothetical protein
MSTLEAEWTIMVELTNARARATGITAAINHKGAQRPAFARVSQNMATVTVLLDTLLAPSTNRVSKVYRQLKDILGIIADQ